MGVAVRRSVSLAEGLRYRGQAGMWSWALHRVTGIGMLLLVGTHVTASFAGDRFGSVAADTVNVLYQSRQLQVLVYFCIIYHVVNGARLAVTGLAPSLVRFHRELIWLEWAILIPAFALPALLLLGGSGGG